MVDSTARGSPFSLFLWLGHRPFELPSRPRSKKTWENVTLMTPGGSDSFRCFRSWQKDAEGSNLSPAAWQGDECSKLRAECRKLSNEARDSMLWWREESQEPFPGTWWSSWFLVALGNFYRSSPQWADIGWYCLMDGRLLPVIQRFSLEWLGAPGPPPKTLDVVDGTSSQGMIQMVRIGFH